VDWPYPGEQPQDINGDPWTDVGRGGKPIKQLAALPVQVGSIQFKARVSVPQGQRKQAAREAAAEAAAAKKAAEEAAALVVAAASPAGLGDGDSDDENDSDDDGDSDDDEEWAPSVGLFDDAAIIAQVAKYRQKAAEAAAGTQSPQPKLRRRKITKQRMRKIAKKKQRKITGQHMGGLLGGVGGEVEHARTPSPLPPPPSGNGSKPEGTRQKLKVRFTNVNLFLSFVCLVGR
jgi:hypothetical protein